MIATSTNESKHLAEILPERTSDMCWSLANPDLPTLLAFPVSDSDNSLNDKIPAWSLDALLNLWFLLRYDVEIKYYPMGWGVDVTIPAKLTLNKRNDVKIKTEHLHFHLIGAVIEMIDQLNELDLINTKR